MRTVLKHSAFALVMLIYLWYPISKIFQQEKILDQGVEYQFRPQPIDPYDAFRGRYIVLNLETPTFELNENQEYAFRLGKTAYVSLGKDSLGFATFSAVSPDVPAQGDYLKMMVNYEDGKSLYLDLPESFQRYYLNEKLAPLAEKKYEELVRDRRDETTARVILKVRVLKGQGRIEQLLFDDQPVEDYLRLQE